MRREELWKGLMEMVRGIRSGEGNGKIIEGFVEKFMEELKIQVKGEYWEQ